MQPYSARAGFKEFCIQVCCRFSQVGGHLDYANSQQFQSLGGTGVYATASIFAFDPSEIAQALPSVDNVVLVFTGHHQSPAHCSRD